MNTSSISHSLRKYRKWHRLLGITIGLLVLISSITGVFLAWKKEAATLQPPSMQSSAAASQPWLGVEEISRRATEALMEKSGLAQLSIDRLDIRPDKGIAKVRFEQGYWEVQVDGKTGEILSIARRHSDWIEQLHDGSIISDSFKVISMNVLGAGLLVLTLSGTWLWLGPKKIRQLKKKQKA
ncbi:MAG: PepSY domain-containing protein [Cyclobacteriaceae bacterium]